MSSWKGLDELAGLGRVPASQLPPVSDGKVSDVQGLFSPGEAALRSALATGRAEASRLAIDVDLSMDARVVVETKIKLRQGQPGFRRSLLAAYSGRCCITGCAVEPTLEAAHIHPYLGAHTNVVSNGLLLRADVHTLFDLRLITVRPDGEVRTAPTLAGTPYASYDRAAPRAWPAEPVDRPASALASRNSTLTWA